MNRRVFDYLVSWAGLVIAVVLLAVGGLMVWGHVYIDHQVHNQLAAQKIFFPPKGSPAIAAAPFAAMGKYAGQQLTTGAQAETYANHFIAAPTNTTLKTEEATLFQGTTLRGMLLNAYAFGTIATIAGIGAIVSFVGAAILLVLAGLGFAHARRLSSEAARTAAIGASDRVDQLKAA